MSDPAFHGLSIASRPALAAVHSGRHGASRGEPGVTLRALPEGFLLHLLARPGDAAGEESAKALAARLGVPLRKTSPGQWYVAGDQPMTAAEQAALASGLESTLAISDQSHGRVRMAVSGPDVGKALAKLVAADLKPKSFPVGHSTTLFAGHMAAHAYRAAEDAFEITVLRGFALDLWESIEQAAREFGVECVGPK